MTYKLDGRALRPGRPFEVNGYVYNYTWMTQQTDDVRTSLGIVYEVPASRVDSKFYVNADTPRDLELTKERLVAEQKHAAGSQLNSTDWYVIRKEEEGTAIPANVTTYRQAVRRVCGEREALVNGAADIPALAALYRAPAEVYNKETDALVANTDPFLPVWPELASE
tara:strand:+ start:6603 stop:7103 length:501 start_codon:yes stop_codon:yes gene_type:complete